jgi:hypothetical protein
MPRREILGLLGRHRVALLLTKEGTVLAANRAAAGLGYSPKGLAGWAAPQPLARERG